MSPTGTCSTIGISPSPVFLVFFVRPLFLGAEVFGCFGSSAFFLVEGFVAFGCVVPAMLTGHLHATFMAGG